jgi:hypothetical protein
MARSIPAGCITMPMQIGHGHKAHWKTHGQFFSNIFVHVFFLQVMYLQRRRLTSTFTVVDTIGAPA